VFPMLIIFNLLVLPDYFDDMDDEIEGDFDCPSCGLEYDEIDYEYQICSYCKFNNNGKEMA